MAEKASTLRPGLLVVLKSNVTGNVNYKKKIIEAEHLTKAGSKKSKWQTERVIFDPDEEERAAKARSWARAAITNVCTVTAFGHLCPEEREAELDTAIGESRKIMEEFNASAKLTRLTVYVLKGRIAADDAEAIRAINAEVSELLTKMEASIKKLDVKAVREAANDVLSIGKMLSPSAQDLVKDAVAKARGVATQINKAGEQAAKEIDKIAIASIRQARTNFLDISEAVQVVAPKAKGRAVDLQPDSAPAPVVKKPKANSRVVEA